MKHKILKKLSEYKPFDAKEAAHVEYALAYIKQNDTCFDRTTWETTILDTCSVADVTASAWLISPETNHVLFTHHKKLSRWLPLGGHCDGVNDVLAVALREANEESGIQGIKAISEDIFDVDVQTVPASSDGIPEHQHIDIRFILFTPHTNYIISNESNDLCWIYIKDVPEYNNDPGILRVCKKWENLIGYNVLRKPSPQI